MKFYGVYQLILQHLKDFIKYLINNNIVNIIIGSAATQRSARCVGAKS